MVTRQAKAQVVAIATGETLVTLRLAGTTISTLDRTRLPDDTRATGDRSTAPRGSSAARDVVLVLALASTQVRAIDGLPSTSDERLLRGVLVASPFRFFLRTTARPVISQVRVDGPGVVTAALCDAALVRKVVQGVVRAGLTPRRVVVPSDPQLSASITDTFESAECVRAMIARALTLPPEAWTDALGNRVPWWQPSRTALALAALCIAGAAVAPGWRLHRASRALRDGAVQPTLLDGALMRAAELDSLQAPLDRMRDERAHAVHPLGVLDALASALPPEGQVVTFEMDTTRVQVSIAAPSLAPVLRRLERQIGVEDVVLLGTIAHDSTTSGQRERGTVRFRLRGARP